VSRKQATSQVQRRIDYKGTNKQAKDKRFAPDTTAESTESACTVGKSFNNGR